MKVLSDNLTDRIMYALENQTETFFLDTKEKELVSLEKNPLLLPDQNPARFWPLPAWRPSDGFQLMKQFVEHLNNPVYGPRLEEVLASGQGVFRKFKGILRENHELDRKWIHYKEKEFRSIIADWYDRYASAAEGLGLKYPDPDEEPETELILTDFVIVRETGKNLSILAEWDKLGIAENYSGIPEPVGIWLAGQIRESGIMLSVQDEVILTAQDPDGQPVGFIWMVPYAGKDRLLIQQLYVLPEFRSLGLGRLLLNKATDLCLELNKKGPDLPTGPGALFLNNLLAQEGYETALTIHIRKS